MRFVVAEGGSEVCASSEFELFPPAYALNDGINMRETSIVKHIFLLSNWQKSHKASGNLLVTKKNPKT